jgi:hypothetical protein
MTKSEGATFQEKSYAYCNAPTTNLANYLLDKQGAAKYDQSPIYTVNVKVHIIQYSNTDPADPCNYTTSDTSYISKVNIFSNLL